MFEKLQQNQLRLAGVVMLGSVMLGGCSQEQSGAEGPIGQAESSASARMQAQYNESMCELARATGDSDCDGTSDAYDQLPGRPDYGDDDGDAVPNVLDKYAGLDDKIYDTDQDSIPDWLDRVQGYDFADQDGDGIIAAYDTNDLLAAQTVQEQDVRATNQGALTLSYIQNRAMQLALNMDGNYDGPIDTAPELPDPILDAMSIDSDHDHVNDYFDSERHNPYITPQNDVYNIGSDAWYDDHQ